jgi:hypothetical protein
LNASGHTGILIPHNLKLFRHRYPQGDSYVVGADVDRVMDRQYECLNVKFVGLDTLIESLKKNILQRL